MGDLLAVFVGDGIVFGRGRGDFWIGNTVRMDGGRRGATGFFDPLVDRTDQLQHVVGGLVFSFGNGVLAELLQNFRPESDADALINELAFFAGNQLNDGNLDDLASSLYSMLASGEEFPLSNLSYSDELTRQIERLIQEKIQAAVSNQRCFSAGTPILMADGRQKPIERIEVGDMVMSFDATVDGGRGALVPGKVVRLFRNTSPHMLDFHGTHVTPGHAYLCGDGPHVGRFRPLMDILRDDGAVVKADGSLIRSSTGCAVGSPGDAFVELQLAHPDRDKAMGPEVLLLKDRVPVRAGTRVQRPDGTSSSFLELIEANSWVLHESGFVEQGEGHVPEPLMWGGDAIPRPEDYILARSGVTLADLYDDPRENQCPMSPLPAAMPGHAPAASTETGILQASGLSGQAPRAASPAKPSPSRKMRRRREAEQRKQSRVRKHAGMTVH